jgi:hypothetical protein
MSDLGTTMRKNDVSGSRYVVAGTDVGLVDSINPDLVAKGRVIARAGFSMADYSPLRR